MKKSTLILLLLITQLVFADGPPIDKNGNISVPHIILELDEQQSSFLNSHRYLKLSDKQKNKLGETWSTDEIEVLDPFYNDCTCGRIYGIWISPKEIAILKRDIPSKELNEDDIYFIKMIEENIAFYKQDKQYHIFIGTDGTLYYKDEIISINEAKKLLSDKSLKYLLLFQPPKKGNKNWNKIILIKSELSPIMNSLNKQDKTLKFYWM